MKTQTKTTATIPATDQATATPWSYDETWALITGPNKEEIAAIHSGLADNDRGRQNRHVAWGNAHLIIQAVNQFEALQAVAEAAAMILKETNAGMRDCLPVEKLKSAIEALAESRR